MLKQHQNPLFEATMYYTNLLEDFNRFETLFDSMTKFSAHDECLIRRKRLEGDISKAKDSYWKDINEITSAYFRVLEMIKCKEKLEKEILDMWHNQLAPSNLKEDVNNCREDPGLINEYEEDIKMKLAELNERMKYAEYKANSYKFASYYISQLTEQMFLIKCGKGKKKWHSFNRRKNKLENDIRMYKKQERILEGELQRLMGLHCALKTKLVPEERKGLLQVASAVLPLKFSEDWKYPKDSSKYLPPFNRNVAVFKTHVHKKKFGVLDRVSKMFIPSERRKYRSIKRN